MNLFGRLDLGAKVEELRPIQADAVGPALDAMIHFIGELDVAEHLDPNAVARFGGQIAQRLQLRGQNADFLGLAPIAGESFLVGLKDHQPLVAVDDRRLAAGDFGEERAGADHGGNFQRLGHDRRVAARPAHLGDEPADIPPVEIRSFTGREIVGQHEHGRGEMGDSLAAAAQQMPQQPLLDVENIVRPLRQIGAFQPLENLGVAPQDAADGIFGRVVPLADHFLQFAAQPGVLKHLQMGLEDAAVLFAQLG